MTKITTFALATLLLIGCATANVELVGHDPAEAYFANAYSVKDASAILGFLTEDEFTDEFGSYKENILNDSTINEKEREEQFAMLGKFQYVDELYLSLAINLKSPVPVRFSEFRFTLNDDSGVNSIEEVFPCARHVFAHAGYISQSFYQLLWIVKLSKPFTKENFSRNEYQFRATYPDGSVAVYKVFR